MIGIEEPLLEPEREVRRPVVEHEAERIGRVEADPSFLMHAAANDAVLPPALADGMEKLVPDLEKYLVHNSGHWTQQEQPEEVSAKLIEWRRRRFG